MLDYDFDAILVLSDNFEGAQTWIEQLTARASETPLGVLATSRSAPLYSLITHRVKLLA